jgi:hypothetical protein
MDPVRISRRATGTSGTIQGGGPPPAASGGHPQRPSKCAESLRRRAGTRLADRARSCSPPPRYRSPPPELLPPMPRTGTATATYQVVEQHWPGFRQRAEHAGGLPRFVVREMEEYLRCGRLEFGKTVTY